MKNAFTALAFPMAILAGTSILTGTSAAAAPVFIQTAGIYNAGHVLATLPGGARDEFSAPVHFTGNYGSSFVNPTFAFEGFCIDLFHNISVGFGSQLNVGLNYHTAALADDGVGNPLSYAQVRSIGGLANIGFGLIGSTLPDRDARLAAIQAAIWSVEYPAISFSAHNSFVGLQGFIDEYVALAPRLSGNARVIYSDLPGNSAKQGFITNVPGVPEPGIWAQLIAGFGLVGAVSRYRRRAMA
jgi:hypothetical protein